MVVGTCSKWQLLISLHCSNVCEAALRSLFWTSYRLNELLEVCFQFLFNLNSQYWWYTAKAKNKDLDSGLQTALARTVLWSLVQATCHKQTFKTEFMRKLNNFNFQWTKTMYQNSLNNIAFFFTFFKGYRYN